MHYPISIKGVLLVDGKVALVRNTRNEWELPGGRIDPGESPQQTIEREFAEELSITVRAGEIIDLTRIPLPAGYARSINSWSERA